MDLVKGKDWHLTINSLEDWRYMRTPPDPVSYFGIKVLNFISEMDVLSYRGLGIYCFPFIFRIIIRSW